MQDRPHNESERAYESPVRMNHAAASHGADAHRRQTPSGAHRAPSSGQARAAGASAYRPVGPDLAKSQDIIRVRKKRKKHSGRKALLIALAVIVCVFGVVGGAAALYFNSINQALSFDDKETIESLKSVLEPVAVDDEKGEQPYYVLVLGSDAREGDTASRSDVIILTRVDPGSGLITMVSIPRDTMVEIEGHGRQKINAAYAYGGAAGAVEAVSSFAGVPISHYAEIHFEELEELVDMLGGVWVDVPVTNDETGSSNSGMRIEAGEQLLNGEQALAFARERYGYIRGDFQRADNQRILAEGHRQESARFFADRPSRNRPAAGELREHRLRSYGYHRFGSTIPVHVGDFLLGTCAVFDDDARRRELRRGRPFQLGGHDGAR